MTLSRRQFLTYVGIGTYAALMKPLNARDVAVSLHKPKGQPPAFFKPIAPSTADQLLLPEGFKYDLLLSWGDALGSQGPHGAETFGFNNDFIAYFPIDALEGGKNSEDGLLWVNHEYLSPLFVSGYTGQSSKTREQIHAEKLSVGGSVLRVRKQNGKWQHVPDEEYTRRITALYPTIDLSGPAAKLVPHGIGTLANCSGGRTPWSTALSCEENYPDFNAVPDGKKVLWGYRWGDVEGEAIDEKGYGWVVEIDPFGELPPRKLSCLGRFKHENTCWRLGPTGKLVIYMGDDEADQYFYKFVSAESLDPKATRAEQRKVLEAGTLYAADFTRGQWLALDLERTKVLRESGFKSQGDILIRPREAAKALQATPVDRAEDCEVHPRDGTVYIAFTNNERHGNVFGQIVRLVEKDDNPEGDSFRYEIFLAGGPQSGLACPDNLAFDKQGNLWVFCDMAGSRMHTGAFQTFGNNGVYVVPTAGRSLGDAFQFASGPIQAECTGPWFTENEETLFLAVQHPGEETKDLKKPTSRWPKGGDELPRPAIVAISGFRW